MDGPAAAHDQVLVDRHVPRGQRLPIAAFPVVGRFDPAFAGEVRDAAMPGLQQRLGSGVAAGDVGRHHRGVIALPVIAVEQHRRHVAQPLGHVDRPGDEAGIEHPDDLVAEQHVERQALELGIGAGREGGDHHILQRRFLARPLDERGGERRGGDLVEQQPDHPRLVLRHMVLRPLAVTQRVGRLQHPGPCRLGHPGIRHPVQDKRNRRLRDPRTLTDLHHGRPLRHQFPQHLQRAALSGPAPEAQLAC